MPHTRHAFTSPYQPDCGLLRFILPTIGITFTVCILSHHAISPVYCSASGFVVLPIHTGRLATPCIQTWFILTGRAIVLTPAQFTTTIPVYPSHTISSLRGTCKFLLATTLHTVLPRTALTTCVPSAERLTVRHGLRRLYACSYRARLCRCACISVLAWRRGGSSLPSCGHYRRVAGKPCGSLPLPLPVSACVRHYGWADCIACFMPAVLRRLPAGERTCEPFCWPCAAIVCAIAGVPLLVRMRLWKRLSPLAFLYACG